MLVLVCERCERKIRGSGAGFAAVDLRETHAAAHNGRTKAVWRVLHVGCAPEVVKPLNPYFRIWTERIDTVDGLLDAMADLSRHQWFGASDWCSLVKRVLADTDKAADVPQEREPRTRERSERKETTEQRRQALVANPDDPRHGTLYAYSRIGCRCDACKAANSARTKRENAPSNAQQATPDTRSTAQRC